MAIKLLVQPSKISGLGLFAQTDIPSGYFLFKNGKIENGRFEEREPGNWVNHSDNAANTAFVIVDGFSYLMTLRKIKKWEELLENYAQAMQEMSKNGIVITKYSDTNFLIFKDEPQLYQSLYTNSRHLTAGGGKEAGHVYTIG